MPASFVGRAAYWGVVTTATGPSGTLATLIIQSEDFEPTADSADIPSGASTVGQAFGNLAHVVSLSGIIVATTGTNTIAGAKTELAKTPDPGTVITIADADDTELTASTIPTSKYVLQTAKKSKAVGGLAKMDITIKQWIDNDVAVAIV